MTAFDDAFSALIGNEGAYTVDVGGPTMWGITEAVARANGYIGDMQALPLETAKAIAKTQYWDAVRCNELPQALAFQVFDAAYNSEPTQAVKWLQAAAHVQVDGVLGKQTMDAVSCLDQNILVERFDAFRLLFMASLSTWPTYGKG